MLPIPWIYPAFLKECRQDWHYVIQILPETVQRMLPDSKVVKALNIVGNPHFIHPDFPGGPPTMFICGNDDEAKKTLIDNILTRFGWETIDIGGIEGAKLLEPLAFVWIMHYFRTGD